jgi:glutathione S-transferase
LGSCDAAVVAKAAEAFHREARMLEAHLAKHPCLAGTGMTLADFSVVAPLYYAEKAELRLQPARLARHGARCRRGLTRPAGHGEEAEAPRPHI